MIGNRIALDTNQAIHVLNDVPSVITWLNTFDALCLPVAVVGELLYGALNSKRSIENLAKVHALVGRCMILNSTVATSRVYAELRMVLKQQGTPIPENDLWIAASCLEHQLPLATDDNHFSSVPKLTTITAP